MKNTLRNNLATAKGLGSAKDGAVHWWHQRLTAIVMIPLFAWLIIFLQTIYNQELSTIINNIRKPYNIIPMIILFSCGFYHSVLGMRIIIEDYVPSTAIRMFLILLVQIFCYGTIVSMIIALLSIVNI